jgi:hypothetical protein
MPWTRFLNPRVDAAMAEAWPYPVLVAIFPGFLVCRIFRSDERLWFGLPNEGPASGCPMPAGGSGVGGEGDAERMR